MEPPAQVFDKIEDDISILKIIKIPIDAVGSISWDNTAKNRSLKGVKHEKCSRGLCRVVGSI